VYFWNNKNARWIKTKDYSKLFATKVIKDNIYWDGTVKIPVLNKDLHDALDVDPVTVRIIFFCSWKTFLLNDEFPQNIIPYSIMVWK
jgi:hypothetical protein